MYGNILDAIDNVSEVTDTGRTMLLIKNISFFLYFQKHFLLQLNCLSLIKQFSYLNTKHNLNIHIAKVVKAVR